VGRAEFYFLEMNARTRSSIPVTEAIVDWTWLPNRSTSLKAKSLARARAGLRPVGPTQSNPDQR